MSFNPHSHRFDPRWLFAPIETEDEETSDALDVSPFSSSGALTRDLTERDIDLALEQVASERCCVYRFCGAIVGSAGNVLS